MKTAFAISVRQVWDFLPSANAPSPTRFAVTVFYLLGTAAVIYHLANGLWTGAIAWGLTPSDCSQQRLLWAIAAFGSCCWCLGPWAGMRSSWLRGLGPLVEELQCECASSHA